MAVDGGRTRSPHVPVVLIVARSRAKFIPSCRFRASRREADRLKPDRRPALKNLCLL
jgi:hypothetical protein